MPWKIISKLAARLAVVLAVLKGRQTVQQLSGRYGISRKTVYKWRDRFLREGRRGLADGSRRPHRLARRIGGRWRQRVVQLRRSHRRWGGKKIRAWLERHHGRGGLPATRTIGRWLGAKGLVGRIRRRSLAGPVVRLNGLTPGSKPNEVWTVDFKGWFRTGDGTRIEPLTVRDMFSRYVLLVRALPTPSWERVKGAFVRLFGKYGLPTVIRVDNGGPFGSTGPAGLSRLSAWWTTLGIAVEFITPGHPEENGGHEQMHRVLKAEAATPPAPNPSAQRQRFRRWRGTYNFIRPHEALKQRVPGELYYPSRRKYAKGARRWAYPRTWEQRRVRTNGYIKWYGRERFVGEAFVGYVVGLKGRTGRQRAIYLGRLLLGVMRRDDVGGLRPTAYVRRHRQMRRRKL